MTGDTDHAAALIDAKIASLEDWRGERLALFRRLIREADPEMSETVKWRKPTNPAGVPVWEHDGIVCTGEIYKSYVKLTFAKGALLDDPARLFNASLNGNARRAIDSRAHDTVDDAAFRAIVRAAVELNTSARKPRSRTRGPNFRERP